MFTAPAQRIDRISFGKPTHHYEDAHGKRIPGVTTILNDGLPKPALINWAANATATALTVVQDVMDAEVIDSSNGMAAARAALKAAQDPKPAGAITVQQLKALQSGFSSVGVKDRDERLRIAAALAGRPDLASANDLTATEAKAVLDGLSFAKATDNPAATLEEVTR